MAPEQSNITEYSVSELSFSLKRTVEEAYEHVRVRGEISGFRGAAASGHCYFTIKDERAALDAIVWKSAFQRLRFKPEEGLEMIATGKLTTYPGRSKYQIVIDRLEPAGAGALMALLEERRKKLAAEGLFDEARKAPLPYLPKVIGVVTSPTGAVIRDILHRLRDRCPSHVLVWPVRVQGETSAAEVASAIRGFNAIDASSPVSRPDVLIVARGGGSIEDLWSFNEEIAVRAVAESAIPIVSAVGHETDWTLIDLASDRRAPTPTGAAEMIVPVRAELINMVGDYAQRLTAAAYRGLDLRRRDVAALSRTLPSLSDLIALPRQRLDHVSGRLSRSLATLVGAKRQALRAVAARHRPDILAQATSRRAERLEALGDRLGLAVAARLKADRRDQTRIAERFSVDLVRRGVTLRKERLASVSRLLETLSHRSALKRGFAMVRNETGDLVREAASLAPNETVAIEFIDGEIGALVTGDAPKGGLANTQSRTVRPVAKPRSKARNKGDKPGQGSLF